MQLEFHPVSIAKRSATLLVVLLFATFTGCYQRTIAPELTYDQGQVETLDQEIAKFEWE